MQSHYNWIFCNTGDILNKSIHARATCKRNCVPLWQCCTFCKDLSRDLPPWSNDLLAEKKYLLVMQNLGLSLHQLFGKWTKMYNFAIWHTPRTACGSDVTWGEQMKTTVSVSCSLIPQCNTSFTCHVRYVSLCITTFNSCNVCFSCANVRSLVA